jgi:hypothetical protein
MTRGKKRARSPLSPSQQATEATSGLSIRISGSRILSALDRTSTSTEDSRDNGLCNEGSLDGSDGEEGEHIANKSSKSKKRQKTPTTDDLDVDEGAFDFIDVFLCTEHQIELDVLPVYKITYILSLMSIAEAKKKVLSKRVSQSNFLLWAMQSSGLYTLQHGSGLSH